MKTINWINEIWDFLLDNDLLLSLTKSGSDSMEYEREEEISLCMMKICRILFQKRHFCLEKGMNRNHVIALFTLN